MKKKKNILALGLTCVLALSLMTGCTGKQQDGNSENNSSGTTVTTSDSDYTGDPALEEPTSKIAVNFEGRVTSVEDGKVTLEDGTVVLTASAEISSPDDSAAEITVGDYIQGYAKDPDAAELNASTILITAL